jgi:hypothetical protein
MLGWSMRTHIVHHRSTGLNATHLELGLWTNPLMAISEYIYMDQPTCIPKLTSYYTGANTMQNVLPLSVAHASL